MTIFLLLIQEYPAISVNRDKSILEEAIYSRFLGNTFLEMEISSTLDGMFFIRNSNIE